MENSNLSVEVESSNEVSMKNNSNQEGDIAEEPSKNISNEQQDIEATVSDQLSTEENGTESVSNHSVESDHIDEKPSQTSDAGVMPNEDLEQQKRAL